MHIFINIFIFSLISLLLASCSTLPTTFTTENLMKVHQGMSSDEVLTIFGEPKNVNANVCGVSPDQWLCTTWEYGDFPYDEASFTFGGKHDSLKLNNFKVKKDTSWD